MSGAEAIIAFGLVASIITCTDMSKNVADRLGYYLSLTKEPPQIFRTLHDQLPLLIQTFEEIKDACEKEEISFERQKCLFKTVQGCVRLIRQLEDHLEECNPSPDDSFLAKGKKAIKGFKTEKRMAKIQQTLETYKSTLTLYYSHLTLVASPDQGASAEAARSKFYEVPAIRVSQFIGRQYLLDRIYTFFDEGSLVLVLVGMGGQGKTQLSLEYCRAVRTAISIFWIDATSIGTINKSFEGIASKLAPGLNFSTPEAARTIAMKKLEDLSDPVLIIFDNCDKPQEFSNLQSYVPHRCKIIFNSRHADAKRLGKVIEIGAMTTQEGVELLLLHSGYDATEDNQEEARKIVETLGGLALAIDQAATYIRGRNMPLSSFADFFARRRLAILKHTPTHWEYSKSRLETRDKPLSVFTTWEMSLEQVQDDDDDLEPLVHLLTLGAFINTRDISEGLFSLYAEQAQRPKWLDYFMDGERWDNEKYQDSLVRLLTVSLVTNIDLMAMDARFSFHPLIAEWLKLRIDDKGRAEYIKEAIHVVRLFVDNGDRKEMPFRDKGEILSHLDTVIAGDELLLANDQQVSDELRDAMVSFGSFYRRLGRDQETKALIERALRGDQQVTPKIRNVLANMYCDRGDLAEAESLYKQVLVGLKEILPNKDPNEHLYSTRLGVFYWTQDDKLNATGTKIEGAISRDYSAFYPWFVSALSAKNGLGIVYMKEGRLSAATTLFKQALGGYEKASGPEERRTLEVVNHLGALEVVKGNYVDAEQLLLRALAGVQVYGIDHTETLMVYCNLGLCYLQSGQLDKAEHFLGSAAHNLQKTLGSAHLFTLTALHNQGLLLLKQNDAPAAEAMLERVVEGWKACGEGGGVAKSEADSKYTLATIYEAKAEKNAETRTLLREAEALYAQVLGKTHPQTMEAGERANQISNLVKIAGMGVA